MRFVFRNGEWVPKSEAAPRNSGPFVWSDLPAYKSPVGTGMIEGRAARREDLRRSGCREVDPSEFKVEGYNNRRYAEAAGRPWIPKSEVDPRAENRAALERALRDR